MAACTVSAESEAIRIGVIRHDFITAYLVMFYFRSQRGNMLGRPPSWSDLGVELGPQPQLNHAGSAASSGGLGNAWYIPG